MSPLSASQLSDAWADTAPLLADAVGLCATALAVAALLPAAALLPCAAALDSIGAVWSSSVRRRRLPSLEKLQLVPAPALTAPLSDDADPPRRAELALADPPDAIDPKLWPAASAVTVLPVRSSARCGPTSEIGRAAAAGLARQTMPEAGGRQVGVRGLCGDPGRLGGVQGVAGGRMRWSPGSRPRRPLSGVAALHGAVCREVGPVARSPVRLIVKSDIVQARVQVGAIVCAYRRNLRELWRGVLSLKRCFNAIEW